MRKSTLGYNTATTTGRPKEGKGRELVFGPLSSLPSLPHTHKPSTLTIQLPCKAMFTSLNKHCTLIRMRSVPPSYCLLLSQVSMVPPSSSIERPPSSIHFPFLYRTQPHLLYTSFALQSYILISFSCKQFYIQNVLLLPFFSLAFGLLFPSPYHPLKHPF